jgi:hypothetical protein
MDDEKRMKLYNLVIAIRTISQKIEDLQAERVLLLDEFKSIQLSDDKLTSLS